MKFRVATLSILVLTFLVRDIVALVAVTAGAIQTDIGQVAPQSVALALTTAAFSPSSSSSSSSSFSPDPALDPPPPPPGYGGTPSNAPSAPDASPSFGVCTPFGPDMQIPLQLSTTVGRTILGASTSGGSDAALVACGATPGARAARPAPRDPAPLVGILATITISPG